MKAYSLDLRERIVANVQQGHNYSETAERFGVSVPTVSRYVERFAKTASLAPGTAPGAKARITPEIWRALEERVQEMPNATLADHRAWLKEQGVVLSYSAVHQNFARRGYTFKKDNYCQRTRRCKTRGVLAGSARGSGIKTHVFG